MKIKKNNKQSSQNPSESNQESALRKRNVELECARSVRKVRIIVNDPYATESSDDENVTRRFVREVSYPLEVTDSILEPIESETAENQLFPLKPSVLDPVTGKYGGVWDRPRGKFASQIHDPFQGKRIWLGTYETAKEASQAYERKRLEFKAMANNINCSSSQDKTSVRKAVRKDGTKNLRKLCEDSNHLSSVLPRHMRKSPSLGNNGCQAIVEDATHVKLFEDYDAPINNDDELLVLAKIGEEFDLDFDLDSITIDESFFEPLDDFYIAIGGTRT